MPISRPKLSIRKKLKELDSQIEIQVGNLFDFQGAFVIGCNTAFDTNTNIGMISKNSLQGQCISRFYHGKISTLDSDITKELKNQSFEELTDDRSGKKKRYPLGTVVKLKNKNKVFYWISIANLNEYGSVEDIDFEVIQEGLTKLWEKVKKSGNIDPLVIPLIGSSRCRIKKSRTEFVKAIIESFVLVCKDKKISEKLIIVISPQDYKRYSINLKQLEEYLICRCNFPDLKEST